MNHDILCPSCEEAFTPPENAITSWFICPHCGARGPNPLALRRRSSLLNANDLIGFVGVVLGVIGVFGASVGTLILSFAELVGSSAGLGRPFLILCGFLLMAGSGVVFFGAFRIGKQGQTALPQLRIAMLLLVGAFAALAMAFGFCTVLGF